MCPTTCGVCPTGTGSRYVGQTPHALGHTFYHAGRQAGSPRWLLTVTLPTSLRGHTFWNVGVQVGTTVYNIKVRVTG